MSSINYPTAGEQPGYDFHIDRGPFLIRVCCAMIALSATAVTLRFVSRKLSNTPLWWDDWLILICLPCSWVPSILMIYCAQYLNFGKHLTQANPSDNKNFWLFFYTSEIFYPISVVLIKSSILLFLYRIFHVPQFKYYASMIGVTVGAWGTATLLVAVFTCNPIDAYWNIMIPYRNCIDILHHFLGIQIPNIILDLIILVLPLPYLWKLHLTFFQKIALSSIFTLGGFVTIVAGLRLETIAVHQDSTDLTYNFINLGIWTAVETDVAILCASLPAMKPLLTLLTHGTFSTSTHMSPIIQSHRSWPKISRPSCDIPSPPLYSPAKSTKSRRANHTRSSSFGFNQPVPMYSKETICDVYDLEYGPGLEDNGSPRIGRVGSGGCGEWYDARCEDYVGRRPGWI